LIAEGICHTARTRVLGVWVPAFAGTTLRRFILGAQADHIGR
jgi:hypothetical protein